MQAPPCALKGTPTPHQGAALLLPHRSARVPSREEIPASELPTAELAQRLGSSFGPRHPLVAVGVCPWAHRATSLRELWQPFSVATAGRASDARRPPTGAHGPVDATTEGIAVIIGGLPGGRINRSTLATLAGGAVTSPPSMAATGAAASCSCFLTVCLIVAATSEIRTHPRNFVLPDSTASLRRAIYSKFSSNAMPGYVLHRRA